MQKILKSALLKIVDAIDRGECEISNEDAMMAIDFMANLNASREGNVQKTFNRDAAADYLNISRSTFNRRLEAGIIPEGKYCKEHNDICWSKATLDSIKEI